MGPEREATMPDGKVGQTCWPYLTKLLQKHTEANVLGVHNLHGWEAGHGAFFQHDQAASAPLLGGLKQQAHGA